MFLSEEYRRLRRRRLLAATLVISATLVGLLFLILLVSGCSEMSLTDEEELETAEEITIGSDSDFDEEFTLHRPTAITLNGKKRKVIDIIDDLSPKEPIVIEDDKCIIDFSDWKLIATLQPYERDIDTFLIDDNEKTAMMNAYLEGKWFIFDIGKEENNRSINRERYLIVQPVIPFQDSDDDQRKPDGSEMRKERYLFESQPTWYTNRGSNLTYASGFIVEFHYEKQKHTVTGVLHNLSEVKIYLNKSGRNFIREECSNACLRKSIKIVRKDQ